MEEEKKLQCECGYMAWGKFCPNCGRPLTGAGTYPVSVKPDKPVINIGIPSPAANHNAGSHAPEPEIPVGWTCTKCGKTFQTGDKCEACGEPVKKTVLFAGSSYMSTNPPSSEGFTVYEFSDTELICESSYNGAVKRRYIPADVIEQAYGIIRENGIDKWEEYKNSASGMTGGSVYVSYRDGDQLVGSSIDRMGSAVVNAYYQLRGLFSKA